MNLLFWKQQELNKKIKLPMLCDETNFYKTFIKDLLHARKEVIIESPFVTTRRVETLFSIFESLLRKGVRIYIITRPPEEHNRNMQIEAQQEIDKLLSIGVSVIFCYGSHHRKLAIVDRDILWEGSLNILSQNYSREIMKRIETQQEVQQMFSFLKLDSII